jgi:predicted choloylglycine hydrolase
MRIRFEAIEEDKPGEKWRANFERYWHGYSRWFLSGEGRQATYLESLKAIRKHMPELLGTYESLCQAAGGGDLEARFLSMWRPPAYVGGCSQAIQAGPPALLVRNYDYSPMLFEGTWLASRFCGKRVLAISDCLWGALDGVNEDGLAVSLSFGGRPIVGEGFGIPLILRYVLEVATNVAEAVAILKRTPAHMSYSVVLVDRGNRHAIVFLAPDREAEVVDRCVVTNHQHAPEWPRHAETSRTVEREKALQEALAGGAKDEALIETFLKPPVYQTAFSRGFGTLYTMRYDPAAASAELIWPWDRWAQSCARFEEGVRTWEFGEA